MMKHTKEPWATCGDGIIESYDGVIIADFVPIQANARRIVACVNACAGISTEDLETPGPGVETAKQIVDGNRTLTSQRDELLAALTHAATDYIDQNGSVPSWWTEKIRQMVKDTTYA